TACIVRSIIVHRLFPALNFLPPLRLQHYPARVPDSQQHSPPVTTPRCQRFPRRSNAATSEKASVDSCSLESYFELKQHRFHIPIITSVAKLVSRLDHRARQQPVIQSKRPAGFISPGGFVPVIESLVSNDRFQPVD